MGTFTSCPPRLDAAESNIFIYILNIYGCGYGYGWLGFPRVRPRGSNGVVDSPVHNTSKFFRYRQIGGGDKKKANPDYSGSASNDSIVSLNSLICSGLPE